MHDDVRDREEEFIGSKKQKNKKKLTVTKIK